MKLLKTIKQKLIPHKKGLEDKWWHRLITVFIIGSAIFVFLIFAFWFIQDGEWKDVKYYYSFEDNYKEVRSEELLCSFDYYKTLGWNSVYCGNLTESEFLERVCQSKNKYDDLIKFREEGVQDNHLIGIAVDKGQLANKFYFKKEINIKYDNIFKALNFIFLITIAWFILWESVIYRVVLYIIYGNKDKKNE